MFPIEFLRRSAIVTPYAIAAVDGEDHCTYEVLLQRCEGLAAGIQQLTALSRPVVAVIGPNSLEMMVAVLAVHACGAVIVPLNGRNARSELDAQMSRARPHVLIAHHDYLEKISPPGNNLHLLLIGAPTEDPRSTLTLERRHAGQRPKLQAGLGDTNGIKFTGGSSGVPKGVLQSFRSTNTMVANVLLAFELKSDERYLCAAPMTHGAGAMILPVLARGGCVVMTADSTAAHLLDLMQKERITSIWVPPTLLYRLIDEQKAKPRDLSALRHLIWSSAPASPARLQEAQTVFGPVIEALYGQTEAPLILSVARATDLAGGRRLNSVGKVAPLSDVAILSAKGEQVGAGDIGEICARGDLVMNGYLDMPDETAKTIRDGWLHTGDLGTLDEDGFLYVKDRLRDVVISGGFNVYPSDVEAVIARHPAVSEVVVFGVPDEHWGERVEAAIELRAGHVVKPEELAQFSKEYLGSVKTPKRFHIMQSLPRSAVGKVLRRDARFIAMRPA